MARMSITTTRFGKWVRRRYAHMTRKRATRAWILTAFAILLYGLTPHFIGSESLAGTLRQFLLIVAGVAAGAIFLPELTENLWTLKRDEVRQIVPAEKRADLSNVLISAYTDDAEWSSLIFEAALDPLLTSCARPSQYVKNMRYSVQAHLHQDKVIDGQKLHFHGIETQSHSDRVLPPTANGVYYISLARTEGALSSEFKNDACLAREIVSVDNDAGVPLEGQEWHDAVKALCKASIAIDGEFFQDKDKRIQDVAESGTDLVRWEFHLETARPEHRVPLYIGIDFPIKSKEDHFPVYFSAFYCAGSTVVSMRIFGMAAHAELRCNAFFAHGLMTRLPKNEVIVDGLVCKQRSFTTGHNSILWPGSGVVFDWHSCPTPSS